MAIAIDVQGRFGASNLKTLRDDEILTEGSLFLADMNHPLGGMGTGNDPAALPQVGASPSIPVANIAYQQLAAVLGVAANPTTLAGAFPTTLAGAEAQWERTARLGVHGAVSRTALVSGHAAYIRPPTALHTFVRTNPKHRFYLSVSGQITRAGAADTNGRNPPIAGMLSNDDGPPTRTSNYYSLINAGPVTSELTYGGELGLTTEPANGNTVGVPFYRDVGSWRAATATPADDANMLMWMGLWGAPNPIGPPLLAAAPSWIIYRVYLEDLTISKRSFDEVSSIARRIHERNFSEGGKYYGDTWTSPATMVA